MFYLEECKYIYREREKIQMSKFITTELKSGSDSDSDLYWEKVGTKFDAELMTTLESGSDSE